MDDAIFQAILHYLKSVNLILIFGLIGIAAVPLFVPRRQRSFGRKIKLTVFMPLAIGFLLWAVAYWLKLEPDDESEVTRWLIPIIDLVVVTAFVSCGSALLRLEERLHQALPPPSPKGFDHRWFITLPARLFGNRWTSLWFLVVGATVLGVLRFVAAEPEHLETFNAIFSSLGVAVLGLGFLRELNRTRADLTGVVTASVLLLYAVSQLLVYFKPVMLPVYTFGIISKAIMFMGIAGFFELTREAKIAFRSAYRQAHEEFSDQILRLLANHRSARHTIFNATSKQGFVVRQLQRETASEHHPHLDTIVAQAKLIEQQAQTLLSLSETDSLFEYQPVETFLCSVAEELDGMYGCRVRVDTGAGSEGHATGFQIPHELLREALHRIIENATQAGASLVILSARSDAHRRVVEVTNNGSPIPPEVQRRLFNTRRGGFWVARRIAINLGGTISLTQSDHEQTRFEIILPPCEEDDDR